MRIRSVIWGAIAVAGLLIASGTGLAAAQAAPKQVLNISPHYVSTPGDGPGGCSGTVPAVCHVTLSNPSGHPKEGWVAFADDEAVSNGSTTTFSPASGTLAPGKSVKVTVTTTAGPGYFAFFFLAGTNFAAGGAVAFAVG